MSTKEALNKYMASDKATATSYKEAAKMLQKGHKQILCAKVKKPKDPKKTWILNRIKRRRVDTFDDAYNFFYGKELLVKPKKQLEDQKAS